MADNEDSDNVFTKLDALRSQQKPTKPTSGSAEQKAAPYEEDNVFKRLDAARQNRAKIESGELPPENREPGYLEDIGRSTIAGLERGTVSLAGLPGDVEQLGRAGINLGARTMGYDNVVGEEAALPTSESMSKLAEEYLPGASYKAKTTPGKFAQTMSEFAPTALTTFIPGLGGVKAGTALKGALASGALSEAAGQVAPEQFEGVARLAGALAGPAAFSKIISPAAGTVAAKVGLGSAAEKVGITTPKVGAMRDIAEKAAENIEQGKGGLSKEATSLIADAEQNLNLPKGSLSSSADIVGSNPTEIINDLVGPSAATSAKFKDDIVNVINNVNTKRADTQKAVISYIKPEIDDTIKNAQNAYLKEAGLPGTLPKGFSDTREVANQFKDTAWGDIVGSVLDNNKNFTSRQLENFLDRPAAKSAVQNALDGIENATGRKPNFLTYDKKTKSFSAVGPVPLEFWHNLKSELYGSNAIGAKNVAKSIEKEIGSVFKKSGRQNEYELANQNYAKFARLGDRESVFDDGRKFVDALGYAKDAPEKQNILRQWTTAMSPAQKDMYQAGFMTRILDDFGQGKAGIEKWEGVFSDPQYSKIAENILNHRPPGAPALAAGQPTNYDKMKAAFEVMNQAAKVDQFKFISSPPVWTKFTRFLPNSVKNAAIGAGLPIGVGAALPNIVEDLALYGPNFAAMSLIGGTAGMLQGIYKNAKTREILRILNDQDPAEMQKLMAEIAKAKKVPQSMRQVAKFYDVTNENIRRMWVERLARTSAAGIGSPDVSENFNTEYQYKNGGRVTYKNGGKVDKKALKRAEKMGRNGDTILAHINRAEAEYLKRMGGSGKINPKTGLREFGVDDGPEAGSTGSASGNSYGGGGGYSSSGGDDSPSESGPGPGMGGWGGGGGGGGGSMASARSSDRASVPGYSGSSYGGGDNAQLSDFFNQASRFGGSEIMSPLQGMSNGVLTGQPPQSQEQMLKSLGIEGAPTPGVVGGLAAPGNVAETGQAATTSAGLAMGMTNVAKEAQASGFNTPYGASGQGVFSDANAAATEKMQLERAAEDQAKAQSQIDAQNAAAGLPEQNSTGLVATTAETSPQTDLSSLYSPAITDFGEAAYAPPVGRFEDVASQPSPNASPTGLLSDISNFVTSGFKSPDADLLGGGKWSTYEGEPAPSPSASIIKEQDRAPSSAPANNVYAGSGTTGLVTSTEAGLTGFESALGTTPTYAVDPNSYQNFKVDPASAYADLKSQLGWKSMFAPSQEDFTKQITDRLTASGSTYDPATGIVSASDPSTMKTLMSSSLPIYNEGELVATLNPSQFAKMVPTEEMRVPMPPSIDRSTQVAEAPKTRGIGLISPAEAAEATAQGPGMPSRPISATPDWAYAPDTGASPGAVAVAQATPPTAPDNVPKSRTIEDFTGPDQVGYQPTGGGGRDAVSGGSERPAPMVAYGQGGQRLRLVNGQWFDSEGNLYEGDLFSSPMESQMTATGGAIRFPEGRVGRATGGRIPDMDKAFKAAKKSLDGHTKVMLNANDDDIVHALRIAKGYV